MTVELRIRTFRHRAGSSQFGARHYRSYKDTPPKSCADSKPPPRLPSTTPHRKATTANLEPSDHKIPNRIKPPPESTHPSLQDGTAPPRTLAPVTSSTTDLPDPTPQSQNFTLENIAFALATLTAGGGITGYIRTGSVPSIAAGVTVGALVRPPPLPSPCTESTFRRACSTC